MEVRFEIADTGPVQGERVRERDGHVAMTATKQQVARVLRKTRLADRLPLTIHHPDGFRMRFRSALMSRNLWVDPTMYSNVTAFVRSRLEPGHVFVDVGANVGLLTLTAAFVVGDQGHVIAVEPHPRVFGYLQENVELNGFAQVECVQCAVGETAGSASLSDREEDDENAIGDTGVTVAVRTIDSIVPVDMQVKVLKLDVEGYELFALRGATSMLERTDSVMFEFIPATAARFDVELQTIVHLLEGHGFRVRSIRPDGTLGPVDVSGDFLATRSEHDQP